MGLSPLEEDRWGLDSSLQPGVGWFIWRNPN